MKAEFAAELETQCWGFGKGQKNHEKSKQSREKKNSLKALDKGVMQKDPTSTTSDVPLHPQKIEEHKNKSNPVRFLSWSAWLEAWSKHQIRMLPTHTILLFQVGPWGIDLAEGKPVGQERAAQLIRVEICLKRNFRCGYWALKLTDNKEMRCIKGF